MPPTKIYTLSLHDALPISVVEAEERLGAVAVVHETVEGRQQRRPVGNGRVTDVRVRMPLAFLQTDTDRKSTRLNSSHQIISYAVFCLKKKKKTSASHQ